MSCNEDDSHDDQEDGDDDNHRSKNLDDADDLAVVHSDFFGRLGLGFGREGFGGDQL